MQKVSGELQLRRHRRQRNGPSVLKRKLREAKRKAEQDVEDMLAELKSKLK